MYIYKKDKHKKFYGMEIQLSDYFIICIFTKYTNNFIKYTEKSVIILLTYYAALHYTVCSS